MTGRERQEEAAEVLRRVITLNPYIAEPRILLAQIHMQRQEWGAARLQAEHAVQLLCCWGTAWDKRLAWEAWMAFGRVILQNAASQQWPTTAFGMLNLGLVEGLIG